MSLAETEKPELERKFFNFNGLKTSYLDSGDKNSSKTIVLIHGFGASAENWRGIYPSLSSEGYRVIGVDLLGFGNSQKPKDLPMSIQRWSDQVMEFCK